MEYIPWTDNLYKKLRLVAIAWIWTSPKHLYISRTYKYYTDAIYNQR